MNALRGLSLALVLGAVLLPSTASAQKNEDSKYTKDASKYIGLAMMRQDPAERVQLYQQALTALQEGMQKEADNAKIWYIAGQAHAGLGHYKEADEAFDKAVQLFPDYKADVEAEREAAWMAGFERGVTLMDANKPDSALLVLEAANDFYPNRPEALLNIASIYANQNDLEKAVQAYEKALAAIHGPLYASLDSTLQQQWQGYEKMAKLNIAQMQGQLGVEAFNNGDFKTAEQWFVKASEANPYSRDYLFNIVQARYAQAQDMEESRDSTAPAPPELIALYTSLQGDIEKVMQFDPANDQLMLMLARSQAQLGNLKNDSAGGQQRAHDVLQRMQAVPVIVSDLQVVPGDSSATVNGSIKPNSAAEGTAVALKITLIGFDGSTVGEQQVSLNVPARDQSAPFNAQIPVTSQVAGWKYAIVPT